MRAKSPPKQWGKRSSEKIPQKKFLALIQEQPQVRAENKSKASKSRQARAEQTGPSFPNHGWWEKEWDRCHFGCLFGLTSKIQIPCVSQSNMGHKYQIVYILFGHFFKHKNVSYNHKNVFITNLISFNAQLGCISSTFCKDVHYELLHGTFLLITITGWMRVGKRSTLLEPSAARAGPCPTAPATPPWRLCSPRQVSLNLAGSGLLQTHSET